MSIYYCAVIEEGNIILYCKLLLFEVCVDKIKAQNMDRIISMISIYQTNRHNNHNLILPILFFFTCILELKITIK